MHLFILVFIFFFGDSFRFSKYTFMPLVNKDSFISFYALFFFFSFFFSGVQFIIPEGPRQSLLLTKDPTSICGNLLYPMCTCPNPPPQSHEAYKGRVNTITITLSFTCYVLKQLISLWLHSYRYCPEAGQKTLSVFS